MLEQLGGVFNIMPTPFGENGQVALEDIPNLVEFMIDKGVNGLTILGVSGEANKLTDDEREAIIRATFKSVAGRIPIVVGTTHLATDVVIYYSRFAEDCGAAGLMISPPTLPKHNLLTVKKHFEGVSKMVKLPIVLQDYPPENNIFMNAEFLADMADSVERITYIKLEDAPTPPKVKETMRRAKSSVGIFGGLGGTFFLQELQMGAVGTMTGFAFPEVLVEIYNKFTSGDVAGAADVYYRYLPLLNFEGQPGIGLAIRKEVLRRRGAISTRRLREPTAALPDHVLVQLDEAATRAGVSLPTS